MYVYASIQFSLLTSKKVKTAAAAILSVKAFFPKPVCGIIVSGIEKVLRVANRIFYKTVSVSVFRI